MYKSYKTHISFDITFNQLGSLAYYKSLSWTCFSLRENVESIQLLYIGTLCPQTPVIKSLYRNIAYMSVCVAMELQIPVTHV